MNIEKEFKTNSGFLGLIIYIMNSHYCGYIGVKKEHFLYGIDYGYIEDILNVHGGLTFSDYIPGYENYWFLGFDCAHFGDKTAFTNGVFRDMDYVTKECEYLAKQISNIKIENIKCIENIKGIK